MESRQLIYSSDIFNTLKYRDSMCNISDSITTQTQDIHKHKHNFGTIRNIIVDMLLQIIIFI